MVLKIRASAGVLVAAALAFVWSVKPADAATITASSCAQSNVSSAISAANVGDVIQVPAGSCSWSGLSINKAIHLRGAGIGQTRIALTGNNNVSKQAAG